MSIKSGLRGLSEDLRQTKSNTNDNVFNDIVKNRNSQYDLISQHFEHYERLIKVDKKPEEQPQRPINFDKRQEEPLFILS